MADDQKITETKDTYYRAIAAHNEVDRQRALEERELLSVARDRINRVLSEKYGGSLSRLRAEIGAALRVYEDACLAAAAERIKDYPSGAVVEWGYPKYTSQNNRTRSQMRPTGRRGIYEIRTRESQFAENAGRVPEVGTIFLRLLKKDGTPGSRFEFLNYSKPMDNWLPEGETPQEESAK